MIRLNLARDRARVLTALGVDLPQYSPLQVLGIWLAATLPLAVVTWIGVPLLSRPSGLAAMKLYWVLVPAASLVQLGVVAWVVRREVAARSWHAVRRRLRLNLPLSPITAEPSRASLWRIVPWAVGLGAIGAATFVVYGFALLIPPLRGLVRALGGPESIMPIAFRVVSPRPEYSSPFDLVSPLFAGQWRWAVLILGVWAFAALAEELLFRGLLLPATRRAFGRWRGPVNGALFALYHVHRPWAIPFRAIEAVALVRPARFFSSTVMALGVRAGEGAVLAGLLAFAVLTPPLRPLQSSLELPYESWHPAPADLRRDAVTAVPSPTAAGAIDLRGRDLAALDMRYRPDVVDRVWFDDRTVWPSAERAPAGFDASRVMELGRNPGLGVRQLHAQGITGRSVGIGIVDRPLLTAHDEYKDRLDWYEELDTGLAGERAQMHGAAVASIAVGRTVGVAPGARLFYVGIGETGALRNLADVARGIQRLMEINWRLPEDRKIQVISLSIGWDVYTPGYDAVEAAVRQAAASGIFVISPNLARTYGIAFQGLGRPALADPDRVESYEPALFWSNAFDRGYRPTNVLLVPIDSRTTASPAGTREYAFYRAGGWSWATPYLAGVYALAVQVNPVVTPERFWSVALATGHTVMVVRNGTEIPLGPIIDPPARIAALGR